jgi:hypothetical protein
VFFLADSCFLPWERGYSGGLKLIERILFRMDDREAAATNFTIDPLPPPGFCDADAHGS